MTEAIPAPLGAIGIVGGGQLALMLAEASRELGIALHVQTPSADDPATRLAASVGMAPLDDRAGTWELASQATAPSASERVDSHRGPADAGGATPGIPPRPGCAPAPGQRARPQRRLSTTSICLFSGWSPLAEVLRSDDPLPADETEAAVPTGLPRPLPGPPPPRLPEGFTFPLMAKASRGGYDGRGTVPLEDFSALERLLARDDPGTTGFWRSW